MRKTILFAIALLTFATAFAQQPDFEILRIEGKPIMNSEFEYIMNKNKTAESQLADSAARQQQLDLFINYKLKVLEAQNQGLDTAQTFVKEFGRYRSQLAAPYLTDDSVNARLFHEAYDHFKQDCDVSHILVRINDDDTLTAYRKALQIRQRLDKEPFDKVADEVSDDPSVKTNHGHLGFFTALQTVWNFEKAMYDLPLNQISQPVRSDYGYHIMIVHSRRPAYGEIHAAHILISTNENMGKDKLDLAYAEARDLCNRAKRGEDFSKLAREHSDDHGSGSRGGDLSWFGINRMVPEFEDAAFALQPGEISEPVKSKFGWHIIKCIERRDCGSFESKKKTILKSMLKDDRGNMARRSFVNRKMQELGVTVDSANMLAVIKIMKQTNPRDSAFLELTKGMDAPVIQYGDVSLTQTDFAKFAAAYGVSKIIDKDYDLWGYRFLEFLMCDHENQILETKYPDFALVIGEYHDGLLLFDISNREVWERAIKDTAGLEAYYKNNAKKYEFKEPHYKGVVISCANQQVADSIIKSTRKMSQAEVIAFVDSLNKDSVIVTDPKDKTNKAKAAKKPVIRAKAKPGIWKRNDNKVVDKFAFRVKDVELDVDTAYPVVIVVGKMLRKKPESYLDVRGTVIANYQDYLEKIWIDKLRSKYKVEIIRRP